MYEDWFLQHKNWTSFFDVKMFRLFLGKHYNNSTVQQNCEPGNWIDNNYKGCQKFKMVGSLLDLCMYAAFDCCEWLKTNMAAFWWNMCSFKRLHEDSDIFLFWLDLTLCVLNLWPARRFWHVNKVTLWHAVEGTWIRMGGYGRLGGEWVKEIEIWAEIAAMNLLKMFLQTSKNYHKMYNNTKKT